MNHRLEIKNFRYRVAILIITSAFFINGLVFNIIFNGPLFNYNLNVVPALQSSPFFGSHAFIVFMNIISNIFNPLLCAGYVLIFYLISHRKLEILVFLIWFIFLSFCLSIIKQAIHQARPYWIGASGVKMLEWTCYTEYGCPSGHSMMGLIIMEFAVRFFARSSQFVSKYIWIFYIGILVMEALIMFSRVILGMHALNQVLFGAMIGLYTFLPYYLFVETFLIRTIIRLLSKPRSTVHTLIFIALGGLFVAIPILLTLLPEYDNVAFEAQIRSIQDCKDVQIFKSFQYKCFEDQTLIMAVFGILLGLSLNPMAHRLALRLDYPKLSIKYLVRCLVILVTGLIPVALLLNPLWTKFNTDVQSQALIIWGCQNVAFFSATLCLVAVGPLLCRWLGLQVHRVPESYMKYVRFELTSVTASEAEQEIEMRDSMPERLSAGNSDRSQSGPDT